ncbi:3-phosphoshikimate 1-carboxyvinyltransferase [Salsipaludibacter albus]|uniref:3-phosphoshikimate 1-carboxyvinyltransferase n=1 Tax=Salsipaludibacter albus TaxID=2849650 RepID=UPI001EE41531|nr:3-phosphoshikimate 1-carboxyvinyltransferase [Salsipaludibacter albus]
MSGLDRLRVVPPAVPPTGTVVPPGSKSLTNRALLLAGLAEGRSRLTGALDAEDTRLMVAGLRRCGVDVAVDDDATTLVVTGLAGAPTDLTDPGAPVDVGTSGTVSRFLGAVLAASPVTAVLDGTPRMRERPMGQLFDALTAQGATITCHARPGLLPATVTGASLSGGRVVVDRPASSQVVSALVLAALLADAPTRIELPHGTPARPYVDMTLATVTGFGGSAAWDGDDVVAVTPGLPRARDWAIEPDASAATYAWALAALHGGDVEVRHLGRDSLQGDVAFAEVLGRMGAGVVVGPDHVRVTGGPRLRGIDVDLTDLPDPGLTLAVVALHADGPTRIRGVAVHRHHETDRIAAAATELRKLGADVVEHDDGLDITPPEQVRPGVVVDTWLDHRMAMAFALAGDVVVDDPGCVDKTWPGYFAMLDRFDMVRAG